MLCVKELILSRYREPSLNAIHWDHMAKSVMTCILRRFAFTGESLHLERKNIVLLERVHCILRPYHLLCTHSISTQLNRLLPHQNNFHGQTLTTLQRDEDKSIRTP